MTDESAMDQSDRPALLEVELKALRRRIEELEALEAEHRRSEAALKELKEFNEEIVQNASEAIVVTDREGRIQFLNAAVKTLLGYEPDELVNQPWTAIVPVEQQPIVLAADKRREQGGSDRYQLELLAKDGSRRLVLTSATPRFQEGRYAGTLAIFTDVPQLARIRRALEEKSQHLQQLLMTSRHLTASLDTREVLSRIGVGARQILEADGCVIYILEQDRQTLTPVVALKTTHREESLRTPLRVDSSLTGRAVRARRALAFDEPDGSGVGQEIPGTPNVKNARLIAAPLMIDDQVLGAIGLRRVGQPFTADDLGVAETFAMYASTALRNARVHDELQMEVEERKRIEQRLAHDAFHDALTGLPNRALLHDRLGLAIERAKRRKDYRFAVLFMDIDRFKVVNDSLGHLAGDRLLVAFARRLEQTMRAVDTLARLGGDEFVLLLEDLREIEDAVIVSQRVKEALLQPFSLEGSEVYVTVSIGIVHSLLGYERSQDVLRDADIAMYRAKELGKDRAEMFDPSMHDLAIARLKLETELRRAIESQEFRLHYQPIWSLSEEAIMGFEALVRWQHPERGLLPPADFLAVAEETGLIIPIGEWVIQEACRQMAVWQKSLDRDKRLTISVNLSGRQFSHPDLARQVRVALDQSGLDPSSLILEITEGVIMENALFSNTTIAQLRQLGISIHMDDFGTGYSSLGALHQFTVDSLKIDRAFVTRMEMGKDKLAFVRTIINLAHDLGMKVIAEGVETSHQADQLRGLSCSHAQGYYFARPMDAQAAAGMIKERLHAG